MYLFSLKRRLVVRIVSFLICVSIFFSVPVYSQIGFTEANHNIDHNIDCNSNETLQEKIDFLRVDHALDSVALFSPSDSLVSDNEWEELEIDAILEQWQKYTKTKFDRWGVSHLLRYAPRGSKEIIRALVKSDNAFKKLSVIVEKIKDAQDALMAYWDEHNKLHYDAKRFYYLLFGDYFPKVNTFLNNSSVALEMSQILSMAAPVLRLMALLGISGIINGFINSKIFGGVFNWKKSLYNGITQPLRNHDPRVVVYKRGYDFFRFHQLEDLTLGDKCVIVQYFLKNKLFAKLFNNEKVKSILAGGSSVALVGGMQAWSDYSSYRDFKNSWTDIVFLHKTSEKLQNSLVEIANLLRALNNIEDIDLPKNVLVLEHIQKYCNKKGISRSLKLLFALLDSSTFSRKVSFWYSRGRLLKAHRLFKEVKKEIIPLLQNIALLGGYRAIAHMMREYQKNSRLNFCFVEFVDGDFPLVEMEQAWVPLIDKEKVVTNTVKLGRQVGASHAVVTGPNGGGKSTFMITVACNVLLSKLGIAAAQRARMSDFSKIRTSMRPQQDIQTGLSTFMAEHRRVDQVKKVISSCKGNILVLLDEPYKGTIEAESASRIYKFGKEVAQNYPHSMLLLATHLRKPIELQEITGGVFANYQMGYIEHESATFERTFKIEPGPAIWWFDDGDKRARFIDWLCAQSNP